MPSTSVGIHGNPGEEIKITVNDWSDYVSVEIALGSHTITIWPKPVDGEVKIGEQVYTVLKALANPEMWSKQAAELQREARQLDRPSTITS